MAVCPKCNRFYFEGRGALSRGGITDYEKVSNIIVRDLKNGYFGSITFDRLK